MRLQMKAESGAGAGAGAGAGGAGGLITGDEEIVYFCQARRRRGELVAMLTMVGAAL
jgi:hypothetical protein